MAGTANKTIQRSVWTLTSAASTSGTFSNVAGEDIIVRESMPNPGVNETLGHIYKDGERGSFASTLGLWVRLGVNSGSSLEKANFVVTD